MINTRNLLFPFLAALVLSLALVRGGTKEEIIRLQKDILNLQNQLRDIQRTVDENNAAFKIQLEQLSSSSNKTSILMESLKGMMDLATAGQKATIADLMVEMRALNTRMDEIHQRINTISEQFTETRLQVENLKNPPRMILASGIPNQPISSDQVYLAAYNDYMQGNYDVAIQGFQTYLAHFRESELADNAQYYIGECYYSQKKYNEAILSFDQVINLYPKGDKVSTALYKKGLSLTEIQKHQEAIDQFKAILIRHANSPEAALARQQLELLGVNADEVVRKPSTRRRND